MFCIHFDGTCNCDCRMSSICEPSDCEFMEVEDED